MVYMTIYEMTEIDLGATEVCECPQECCRVEYLGTTVGDLASSATAFTLTAGRPFLQVAVLDIASSANNKDDTLLVLLTASAGLGRSTASGGLWVKVQVVVRVLQSLARRRGGLHESLNQSSHGQLLPGWQEVLDAGDEVVETHTSDTALSQTVSQLVKYISFRLPPRLTAT